MYKAIIVGYTILWIIGLTSYAAAQQSCLTTYVGGSAITTCR